MLPQREVWTNNSQKREKYHYKCKSDVVRKPNRNIFLFPLQRLQQGLQNTEIYHQEEYNA
jgi:hypothetical protein